MNFIISLYVFVVGLVFGSFFNVCIYRIQEGGSLSYPPSHCTKCNNRLKWYDLIPVVSYVVLKGKCRYCHDKISLRYPIIELITGLLFYATYYKYGLSLYTLKFVIFISMMLIIGMIDFDTTDVYFSTIIASSVVGIIFIIISIFLKATFITYILGAIIGAAIIAIIIIASKIIIGTEGMGWGDAEICLVCGLFLGVKLLIVTLFISFIVGGIIGAALLILKIKTREDYIPFGPFIAIAAIVTVFFGQSIVNQYLSMMIR